MIDSRIELALTFALGGNEAYVVLREVPKHSAAEAASMLSAVLGRMAVVAAR